MGLLNGSLQIGRSALLSQQSMMQIIGNNIANAGNSDYTRQTGRLSPVSGSTLPEGFDPGAGVQVTAVERHIDLALEQRLRSATSDTSHDELISQYMGRLETLYNELTDNDLSTGLDDFFKAFSTLNSQPADNATRSVVIEQGKTLVTQIQSLRKDIVGIFNELSDSMTESIDSINSLAQKIADLNVKITSATSTGDTAGALLDQRDTMLKQLSQLTDIQVVDEESGAVTIYIDSDPLVQANHARKLEVVKETQGDVIYPRVYFSDTNRQAHIEGGRAGAVDELINQIVKDNLNQLDNLAKGLIYEVNNLHTGSQGLDGYSSVTSSNFVLDPSAALNNAGLPFTPVNGSFMITVKDANSPDQQESVHQINIDLLSGAGTTLTDLANQISAIPNLSATVQADGKLKISTNNDNITFTFNDDTSHVLTALGINGFFTGTDASTIEVNPDLVANSKLVAAGANNNPLPGDGKTAAAIAQLPNTASDILGGLSITQYYNAIVSNLGAQTATAQNNLEIHSAIQDTLQSQRESISGVSLDEETINLMSSQRAFQGAAKFISVINELLQDVIQMV